MIFEDTGTAASKLLNLYKDLTYGNPFELIQPLCLIQAWAGDALILGCNPWPAS